MKKIKVWVATDEIGIQSIYFEEPGDMVVAKFNTDINNGGSWRSRSGDVGEIPKKDSPCPKQTMEDEPKAFLMTLEEAGVKLYQVIMCYRAAAPYLITDGYYRSLEEFYATTGESESAFSFIELYGPSEIEVEE